MQVPRTLDLRVPVPPQLHQYLPLITMILTLAASVFRIVLPLVQETNKAYRDIRAHDPQVRQEPGIIPM